MATVAEMIEFFKTLPQDAIVECGSKTFTGHFFLTEVDIKSTYIMDYRTEQNRRLYRDVKGDIFIQLHGRQVQI